METQKDAWEESFTRKDNFVFYPHEEVVRFAAKYIRKRVSLNEFREVRLMGRAPKLLDLGCGIGRHVIFGHEIGLDGYGVDLSENAIRFAVEWGMTAGLPDPESRFRQGDVRALPWENGFFDFVVSHGVLDSMPFEMAKSAIPEVHRVLGPEGLFYCDLVSGDDSRHSREFRGEEIVDTLHEQGTVQSYFNFEKVNEVIHPLFEILELVLIRREDVMSGGYISRYHLILRKE